MSFAINNQEGRDMSSSINDIWTDETSVLFTSFWNWRPEVWGTVGWASQARRDNLMKQLSDPFITVVYVTKNQTETDPDLKGKMAGFYLVSHELGHKNKFTHPSLHSDHPSRWQYSNRALRAFSYLPEYRPQAKDVFPGLASRARSVATQGEILTDPDIIKKLKEIPCKEVPVYQPVGEQTAADNQPIRGMVRAGPASSDGYEVNNGSENIPRDLYILRLEGDIGAYLGRPDEKRAIIKIGLSFSPDMRRQSFQKAMPRGVYRWKIDRTLRSCGFALCPNHAVALRGEYAMKQHLAVHAEWLGSEFYLADEDDIATAWEQGCDAVNSKI